MQKSSREIPRKYDGTDVTTRRIRDLLPKVVSKIGSIQKDRPDLILLSWPDIIGTRLAPMTEAMSFRDGTLFVKVKNSTLHSLLSQKEKSRLLQALRKRFPSVTISNIVFRLG